jgi:transcriptional regulator with XRE-family HTH domain
MLIVPLHSDDYRTLVALLKQARKEAGLTQVQVAARLGVEQSLVSKVERRERRLDVAELRAFCDALGISLVEFVSRFEAALSPASPGTVDDK